MMEKQDSFLQNDPYFVETQKWLTDPSLTYRLQEAICQRDASKGFVIGEEDNALQLYFDIIVRQSVEVEGLSGGGKNNLVDGVLGVCPDSWYKKLTSISPKYLRHLKDQPPRILYIAERKGLENGQESTAEYDIKVSISEGKLTVGFVSPAEGLESTENEVQVEQFITTTTDVQAPEELENRLDTIHVHDSRAINARVRDAKLEKAASFPWTLKDYTFERKVAQYCTRLIDKEAPQFVVVPYSKALTEILSDERTAVRRHTDKILNMIVASARIHYCQREITEGPEGKKCLVAELLDLLLVLNIAGVNLQQKLAAVSEKMVEAVGLCSELVRKDKPITTTAILALAKEKKLSELSSQRTVQDLVKALRDRAVLIPKFNPDGSPAKGEHGAFVYDFEESNAELTILDVPKIMAAADAELTKWKAACPSGTTFAPMLREPETHANGRTALVLDALRPVAPKSAPVSMGAEVAQSGKEAQA